MLINYGCRECQSKSFDGNYVTQGVCEELRTECEYMCFDGRCITEGEARNHPDLRGSSEWCEDLDPSANAWNEPNYNVQSACIQRQIINGKEEYKLKTDKCVGAYAVDYVCNPDTSVGNGQCQEATRLHCLGGCEYGRCIPTDGTESGYCFNFNTKRCSLTQKKFCCPPDSDNTAYYDRTKRHFPGPESKADCEKKWFYQIEQRDEAAAFASAKYNDFINYEVCEMGCCCEKTNTNNIKFDSYLTNRLHCAGPGFDFYPKEEYIACDDLRCENKITPELVTGSGCCLRPGNNFGSNPIDASLCCPRESGFYNPNEEDVGNQIECYEKYFIKGEKAVVDKLCIAGQKKGICCEKTYPDISQPNEPLITAVIKTRVECNAVSGQTWFEGNNNQQANKQDFCDTKEDLGKLKEPEIDTTSGNKLHTEECRDDDKTAYKCTQDLECKKNAQEISSNNGKEKATNICCRPNECAFDHTCIMANTDESVI